MIKSIRVQNCQSHKDTFLKFDSGVNVIVGDTDSGKSALMRSLRYALWNRPSSKALISHWGGVLQVELKLDNDTIIRKSDSKEIYLLNDLEFHSFGTKVPEEIEKVINMNEINSQEQIDSFFLLTESPGYVASYLNKIANLEQIDSTIKSIKKELNETNRLIEHQSTDLKKKEAELKSFDFLSEFKKELSVADELQSEISVSEVHINVLEKSIAKLSEINNAIDEKRELLLLKPDIDAALETIEKIDSIDAKLSAIKKAVNKLQELDEKITKLESVSKLKELVDEAINLQSKQNDMDADLRKLNSITGKLSNITEKIENLQSEIATDKEVYETELHKLGKCFFCGSKLK